MRSFHHSGDLGDIVYSLPTIKALGGGPIQLGKTQANTMLPMTIERARSIEPLLKAQPYIRWVTYGDRPQPDNLDAFRGYWDDPALNIAQKHLKAFRLALTLADKPWLTVPEPKRVARVVISRSGRYHNPIFSWRSALDEFEHEAVFVGLESEYAAFQHAFRSKLEWYATADLLALAQVIAGAEAFVGNQSAPYAIAEALKMSTLLEVDRQQPNCIFNRPNARYMPDPRL